MKTGKSRVTNMLINMLDINIKDDIDNYVKDVCLRNFVVMNSMDQVNSIFGESLNNYLNSLSEDEFLNLRSWTGYNFKNINAILRGNWIYEKNGKLTDDKSIQYRELANLVGVIVNKYQSPKIDFITFRGVTLDSFSGYGIKKLSELESLSGKFLYEQGFTSTSMLEETSYFNKDIGDGENYNIKIRYLISSEFDDGALLTDNSMSYSVNQNEYLINKNSLSKVIDVKVDEDSNTATLTVILIPKKIWNLDKNRNISSSRNK